MTEQEQDNQEVLERMRAQGDLLVQSRPVTFTVAFLDGSSAGEFANLAIDFAGEVKIEHSGVNGNRPWDVHVTRDMIPTNAAVSEFETRLQRAADPFHGENDGWYSIAINFPFVPLQ